MSDNRSPYPVRVDASLDASLSRGLWLVKWLLLIPHYVVLFFLWIAFTVVGVVAFFAILFTGRYPRALFDFNVGVLRWSWRVHHYGYGALGTDRYPPFTLADVPDHPAHLDVTYPERLSRGLIFVKWLLALPHYLVLALFVGGGVWFGAGWGSGDDAWDDGWAFGGLVALLVLVAGVVLLFTGRYPKPLYDFVLGMDRWALRVAAYTGLMTDRYPPFRLDMGGTDPGSVPAGPLPTAPAGGVAARPVTAPAASPSGGWTAGRVVAVVVGALLLLASTGPLAAGGALLWADQVERDDAGFVWTPDATVSTAEYALVSEGVVLEGEGLDWVVDDLLGTALLEVTPADPDDELFVAVGRTAEVDEYLSGVGRGVLGSLGSRDDATDDLRPVPVPGGPPAVPPGETDVWAASATGSGTQVLDWRPAEGNWTVVVMRADGSADVSADIRAAATVPGLTWLAVGLLVLGLVLAGLGVLLIANAVRRAGQYPPSGGVPAQWTPPPPVAVPGGGPARSSPPAHAR
ncbi:DUF4389 domain-containing protein [Geodermatophilus maliterrae]|uniref:DUF4389 domain-containing protein n=1 Tax=Geodermatophilus maliterrae TaxID=3162531 RepID=A0ABV3XDM6_9ACTN